MQSLSRRKCEIRLERCARWAKRLALAVGVAASAVMGGQASAQTWPAKDITFVVAWPPGGGADVTARLFAERMSKRLGQSIVVENRPGAGGTIGANSVIQAKPDGYTFLVGAISEISIATATNKEMPFNTAEDLTPIIQLAKWNHILVANPDFPPDNVETLKEHVKAHSDTTYSTWGTNTLTYITGDRLKKALGLEMKGVPFQGSNPSLTALMGGHVQFGFDAPATSLKLIEAGKLKAIGVMGPERLPNAPNIPTIAEAGLPDFHVDSWIGLFAPKGTPADIIARMNEEARAALESPDVQEMLAKALILPGGGSPKDFRKIIDNEVEVFKSVASSTGG